jgi:hypothetical protein
LLSERQEGCKGNQYNNHRVSLCPPYFILRNACARFYVTALLMLYVYHCDSSTLFTGDFLDDLFERIACAHIALIRRQRKHTSIGENSPVLS